MAEVKPGGPMAQALREALAEMGEVFSDLVKTAEEKARLRCPYMDTKRECTAAFDCPNQVFVAGRARPLCSGQHKINFARPDSSCAAGAHRAR